MAAYRRVYDSRHLQADCQEPGSALEPYDRQSSTGYISIIYREVVRPLDRGARMPGSTPRRMNIVSTVVDARAVAGIGTTWAAMRGREGRRVMRQLAMIVEGPASQPTDR